MFRLEDTICAPVTQPSKNSAISIVRISGKDTLKIFSKIAIPTPPYEHRKMILGKIFEPKTKKLIDNVQWVYYRKPKSYTGEDMIEIFTHGGLIIPEILIKILLENGARFAEPGEFTLRAVLNGKMDMLSAQAINQIVKSENLKALEISLKRLEGQLTKKFEEIFEKIKNILARIEVNLNYPEEDLPPFSYEEIIDELKKIVKKIKNYLKESEISKKIFEGIKISICGAPNVGKSTLFNRFLKKERAIVSEIPGTTRDYLGEYINIKGINALIYDTAGLRVKPSSKIEKEGIKRAEKIIKESHLIIWMFDAFKKPKKEELKKIRQLKERKKVILVINKIDKGLKWKKDIVKNLNDNIFEISALKGYGIEKLRKEIEKISESEMGSAEISLTLFEESKLKEVIRNLKEGIKLLKEKKEEISSIFLKQALYTLNIILGKDINEEILSKIFSDFCVGK